MVWAFRQVLSWKFWLAVITAAVIYSVNYTQAIIQGIWAYFANYALNTFPELFDVYYDAIGSLNEKLGILSDPLKYADYFFDITTWAAIFASAYSVKLTIRGIRWALSMIPTLNAG